MSRNRITSALPRATFPRTFLVIWTLAVAVSAFAQGPQQEPASLDSAQKQSSSCNPSDLQSDPCDGVGVAELRPTEKRTSSSAGSRGNQLSHSPAEPPTKSSGLEDSQYEKVIEPPTEFQKFVENSVGQRLPIYGASLFDRVPSTYAPVDRVPVGDDYLIGPGDELNIRVWGQINFERRLVVDRTGTIFIPQVGQISVSGLHFSALPGTLKASVGRVFRNFEVSVNMGQLRSIQIFVMGHARRPGTYTVSSLSTLVNALFISGGPSSKGSMRHIELKRGGQIVTHFDMYDLLLRGDKTNDAILKPGDVVFIPPAGARVAVAGSVESAAIYEIQAHCTLREVLSDAGGLSSVAAGQHAVLERIDDRVALVSENVPLRGPGLETTVQDGDIVSVLNLVPRFIKTVALKGNVADPVRLPWQEGMRVSDLIPEKRALLTRGYWTEHNRLNAGSADFIEEVVNRGKDVTFASAFADDRGSKARKFNQKNDFQPPAPEINWSYAAIERLDEQNLTTRLIPFNLGKAVLERDEASDLPLQPGDVVNIFSLADFTTPLAEQSRIVRLEGEVKMAGIYSVQPGETLRQLVQRAGGLTDRAYLYAATFTRESAKRAQQKQMNDYIDETERQLDQNFATLGGRTISADQQATFQAGLRHQREMFEQLRTKEATGRVVLDLKPGSRGAEALPELPLENGDRLIVPGTPATVSVMGTVYNQSTFLYMQDSSVRDYLKRSGGPTKYADVSQMFLIRANGAVVSKAKLSHFDSVEIRPGDAVIVPSNSMKFSMIRNFLDWSQVLSGFGLAAAAVNVLK